MDFFIDTSYSFVVYYHNCARIVSSDQQISEIKRQFEGYRMVPFSLKVLAKFGLCSNCSPKMIRAVIACSCFQKFFQLLVCPDSC